MNSPQPKSAPKSQPSKPVAKPPSLKLVITTPPKPAARPSPPEAHSEATPTKAKSVKTSALQTLQSRLRSLRQHLQMSEAALVIADQILEPGDERSLPAALALDAASYPDLNHPAKNKNHALNLCRRQNCEYAVIITCSYLEEYLKNILRETLKVSPERLLAKAAGKRLGYDVILALGSYEKIVDAIVEDVSQTKEPCGANSTLKKVLSEEQIEIEASVVGAALLFLDMRHSFVHSSGVISADFAEKHGDLYREIIGAGGAAAGDKFPKTALVSDRATASVAALCNAIDAQVIAKKGMQLSGAGQAAEGA